MKTKTSLRSLYNFPGFRALARFKCGIKGDPKARVIQLVRRQKKRFAQGAAGESTVFAPGEPTASEIWMPPTCVSIWTLNTGAWLARTAA
jgi:hypothetical protein